MKKIAAVFALSAVILTACQSKNAEKELEISVNDQLEKETIIDAVNYGSEELCETLKIEENKKLCKERLSDKSLAEEAKNERDTGKCDEIRDNDSKERCKIIVEKEIERDNSAENLQKELDNISKIVEGMDTEKCNEINDEQYRKQCANNIYLMQAAQNKDPKPCENIIGEDLKALCIQQINSEQSTTLEP